MNQKLSTKTNGMASGLLLAILIYTSDSNAQIILTFGAGTAVTVIDRAATFNSVVTGTDLTDYSENNLSITIPDSAYLDFPPNTGFSSGYHYPFSGANAPTVIKTTDALEIQALEFNIGTGYGGSEHYFAYEVLDDGLPVAQGSFSLNARAGSVVVGLRDVTAGFDEVRFANYQTLQEAMAGIGSGLNGLAIDNLNVQINASAIPEPSHFGMITVLGLVGFVVGRRYRSHTRLRTSLLSHEKLRPSVRA